MRQELQILYEDPDIIVCFKPHGLATQSHRISTPDLEHMILNHLAEAEHSSSSSHKHRSAPYLAVIHRLDQPVSGILVFAKNPKAARNLNHQLTNEGFGKHYMARSTDVRPKRPIRSSITLSKTARAILPEYVTTTPMVPKRHA